MNKIVIRTLQICGIFLLAISVYAGFTGRNVSHALVGNLLMDPTGFHSPRHNEFSRTVQLGDRITMRYTGFRKSRDASRTEQWTESTEFVVGSGQLLPVLEQEILGMKQGKIKRVEIPASEAYGPEIDGLILDMPRSVLPSDIEPEPGMVIRLRDRTGNLTPVTILKVGTDSLKVDLNHPLAGQDLVYLLEVTDIAS